jgi:hypothetical protein
MLTGLAALESMDWSKLYHAYGRATDTPDHLRAFVTGNTKSRENAIEHLWSAIIHQGTPYTATGPAALVIAGLLSDERLDYPDESIRADLLSFLVTVAEVALGAYDSIEELERFASYDIEEYIDSDDDEKLYEDENAQNAFYARAILGCIKVAPVLMNVMLEGMASMDLCVRTNASMGAAILVRIEFLRHQTTEIESRLLALARSAQNSDERSAHVLALGDIGFAPVAFLEDPSPAVQMCAALAPGLAENPAAIAILLNALERHVNDIDNWFTETPPQFSRCPRFNVVARLVEQVTEFERLADAAVAVAGIASKYSGEYDWGLLLARAFPDATGIVKTDAQRRFLAALVANKELWDPICYNARREFKKNGLPHDRELCAQLVQKG